jgi:predicted enzyme related to lactoylglutathione lyase
MGFGNGPTLELVQYLTPSSSERQASERNVLGSSHFGISVDDADETFKALVSRGALGLNPPVEVVPGKKVCYLQDPEGNWIELVELKNMSGTPAGVG